MDDKENNMSTDMENRRGNKWAKVTKGSRNPKHHKMKRRFEELESYPSELSTFYANLAGFTKENPRQHPECNTCRRQAVSPTSIANIINLSS
jgi:hypothetical protein